MRPLAVAIGVAALVIATPVAGVVGVAGWQEYAPASLRAVIQEMTALTDAPDLDGVVDNLLATFDRNAHPG